MHPLPGSDIQAFGRIRPLTYRTDFFPSSTHSWSRGADVNQVTSFWEGVLMAKRCDVCGKGPRTGVNYTFLRSHFNPHNRRRWLPNLQSVRARIQNTVKRMKVCTSCLKAGKIARAL